jgi:hypothetical protein
VSENEMNTHAPVLTSNIVARKPSELARMELSPARRARVDSCARVIAASAIAQHQRMDANEAMIFARQLEDIDTQLYAVEYPELQAMSVIPIRTNVNPGADSYTYRASDRVGRAEVATNWGTAGPRVDIVGSETLNKLVSTRLAYGYSIQDLRRAAMANLPLETELAEACRQGQATKVDNILFSGESSKGIVGLANAAVSTVSPAVGTWSSASALQILQDIRKMENAIVTDSKGVEKPTTLLTSVTQFGYLSAPLGDNADKSIIDWLKTKLLYVKEIVPCWQLELADAEGDGGRLIMYTKNPSKLQGLLPVEFESFPATQVGLEFVIETHSRVGGVAVRYPLSMRYMDGC